MISVPELKREINMFYHQYTNLDVIEIEKTSKLWDTLLNTIS